MVEAVKLIVAGDSWTYGSEIRDPDLPAHIKDWDLENDGYRIPRIWPTKLGQKLGAREVINLSYPASSNDRISRVAKNYIIENHLNGGMSASDIFLVIGWTSPERKDFYYKDHDTDSWITIWPMWDPGYRQSTLGEFHKIYVKHMWNQEEYISRYVNQVLDMQNFCKAYGIRYLFFQGFYQHMNRMIRDWTDRPYAMDSRHAIDMMTWSLIDGKRFMMKDDEIHSFHNYIMHLDRMNGSSLALSGQHPSEVAHTWWADRIADYCEENCIW